MNLKQIKSVVNTYKGATLSSNLDNATIKSGYMVSLNGYEYITTVKELTNDLLKEYKRIAKRNGAYVGLWLDSKDLYLDLSVNIQDKRQALKIARDNEQLAIYDCKNEVSIYV